MPPKLMMWVADHVFDAYLPRLVVLFQAEDVPFGFKLDAARHIGFLTGTKQHLILLFGLLLRTCRRRNADV